MDKISLKRRCIRFYFYERIKSERRLTFLCFLSLFGPVTTRFSIGRGLDFLLLSQSVILVRNDPVDTKQGPANHQLFTRSGAVLNPERRAATAAQ
jgi:hypothetical protein